MDTSSQHLNAFWLKSYAAFSNLCRRIKLLKHMTMSRRDWSWRHCCTKSSVLRTRWVCAVLPHFSSAESQSFMGANQHPEVRVIVRKLVSVCLMSRKKFNHVAQRRKKSKILRFLSRGRNSQTQASRDCSESPSWGVCHLSSWSLHIRAEEPGRGREVELEA